MDYVFPGDHDAVLVLLLIPRVIAKAELLASQVKEKVNICLTLV